MIVSSSFYFICFGENRMNFHVCTLDFHVSCVFCCPSQKQLILDQWVSEKMEFDGLTGFSIFWGGLVRVDVLKVFNYVTLIIVQC